MAEPTLRSRAAAVALLEHRQVPERLAVLHARHLRQPAVHEVEQVLVVAAGDLGQVVEAAGARDQVGDLVQRGQRVGGGLQLGLVDAQAEHAHRVVADQQRVGDGGDLHDAVGGQAGDALAHGRLGDVQLLRDLDERLAAVLDQRVDDPVVEIVSHVTNYDIRRNQRSQYELRRLAPVPASTSTTGQIPH